MTKKGYHETRKAASTVPLSRDEIRFCRATKVAGIFLASDLNIRGASIMNMEAVAKVRYSSIYEC